MSEILGEALEMELGRAPVVVIDGGEGVVTVPTFADLFETTAEEVTVLKDDSYFGSGGTVTFMVARNLASGEKQTVDGGYVTDFYPFLKRKNGDYMVPKPHSGSVGSPAPANQIGAVIASYFDHPEILYGSTNTPFSPELDREAPMRIDCSGFASLVLYGIGYEKSRFAADNAENVPGAYAGMTLPRNPRTCIGGDNRRHCYNAAEMAMFYAQQNRLFYIDYEREQPAAQLQTGDVLFFSRDFVYESDTDYGRRYLHIDHAAIVLSVYPESDTVLVANAGLPLAPRYWEPIRSGGGSSNRNNINLCFTQISGFDAETKMGTVVYARPIYPFLEQKPVQIIKRAEFKTDVPSPTTPNTAKILARLFFKKPMAANRIYTLIAEGDLPNDPALHARLTLLFSDGTNSIHQRITELVKFGDKVGYVFIPPEDVEQMQNVYLSALLPTAAEGTDDNIYNLRKIAVYEGVGPDAPALIERVDNPIAFTDAVDTAGTSFSCEAWRDGGMLHLHAAAPLAAAGTDGEITLGTIRPECFPRSGLPISSVCTAGGGETRVLLIGAGGVIKTMRKSTDEVGDLFQFDLTL